MNQSVGKIRVYVRIRPLSKSELERKCEEAIIKVLDIDRWLIMTSILHTIWYRMASCPSW